MGRQITSKEIIATLKTKFPRFSKATLCMVRHPEAYGCVLSEDAARTLHEIYPDFECAQKPFSRVKLENRKKPDQRKKQHRVTLRLDDAAYAKFEEAAKSASSKQVFLEKLLEDYYDDK